MKENPFTAKARPKLRSFGATKPSITKPQSNGATTKKVVPWAEKLAAKHEAEMRGILHKGSEKADFVRNGIRYANCRDHNSWWSIDVSTGDVTVTFHNRFGSWASDREGGKGWIEPRKEVAFGCQSRYLTELKRIGAELPYFLRTNADKREADGQRREAQSKAGKNPPPKKKPAAKKGKAKAKSNQAPKKPKLKGWGK